VAGPIVALVPVAFDDRLRYRIMHNHLDLALTAALLTRPDFVIVWILMPLYWRTAKTARKMTSELRRPRLAPLIARANTTTGSIAFTAARLRGGLADRAIRRIVGEGACT